MGIIVKAAFTDSELVAGETFSHGFYGNKLDERTQYSSGFVETHSNRSLFFDYSSEDLNITIDGTEIECHELTEFLKSLKIDSLLLDSTSLDIPELALIFSAISKTGITKFLIMYVEPDDYTSKESEQPAHEDFDLSEDIIGFEASGIPTISQPFSESEDNAFVFFLGFEENRLLGAFETFDIDNNTSQIIFGVPAFKSGWETRSFKKNIRILKDNSLDRIGYCAANNPYSAIKQLRIISEQYKNTIYVLPIGTKPNSIGALLYLVENDNCRLLYDQPRKKSARSYGVGRKHLYMVHL